MGSGDSMKLLLKAQNPRHQAPGMIRTDVSDALDAAILTALSGEREERPESADSFRRALLAAHPEARSIEAGDVEEFVRGCAKLPETLPPRPSEDFEAAGTGSEGRYDSDEDTEVGTMLERVATAERSPHSSVEWGLGLLGITVALGLALVGTGVVSLNDHAEVPAFAEEPTHEVRPPDLRGSERAPEAPSNLAPTSVSLDTDPGSGGNPSSAPDPLPESVPDLPRTADSAEVPSGARRPVTRRRPERARTPAAAPVPAATSMRVAPNTRRPFVMDL